MKTVEPGAKRVQKNRECTLWYTLFLF